MRRREFLRNLITVPLALSVPVLSARESVRVVGEDFPQWASVYLQDPWPMQEYQKRLAEALARAGSFINGWVIVAHYPNRCAEVIDWVATWDAAGMRMAEHSVSLGVKIAMRRATNIEHEAALKLEQAQ